MPGSTSPLVVFLSISVLAVAPCDRGELDSLRAENYELNEQVDLLRDALREANEVILSAGAPIPSQEGL